MSCIIHTSNHTYSPSTLQENTSFPARNAAPYHCREPISTMHFAVHTHCSSINQYRVSLNKYYLPKATQNTNNIFITQRTFRLIDQMTRNKMAETRWKHNKQFTRTDYAKKKFNVFFSGKFSDCYARLLSMPLDAPTVERKGTLSKEGLPLCRKRKCIRNSSVVSNKKLFMITR
jgi:hypothetical protein